MRKFFILFLFIISEASAQTTVNDSAQVRHDYQPTALNFSLRAEYYLKNGSYFFAEALYKSSKSYYSTSEVFKEYLWVGYEHKASEKWYLGISGRTLQFPKEVSFIGRVNVSHRGKIRSLGFLKELTMDQISRKSKQNYVRAGLAIGLYKKIRLGKTTIIPVLSYKAYEIFDLKNPNTFFKNRLIDLTRLRLDVYVMVHKNLFLGIYAMRETDYYYTLGYSVPDPNNPSVMIYYPDFKVNSIIPTFGFSLNFILNPDNNTSLIPGLPLR
ncbi:MAG TPA: hypothetical protein VNW99_04530 [Cytophagaceae bacterium]|jgi:hypothetical protein|nr:hypothetical protein [Cytophagaceae bacterium]